jgi:23S rRNA pseudouridine1911/1915/1917 synthase
VTRLRGQKVENRPDGVPEGSVVTVFRVPPESAGMRLDVFLTGQLRRTSRNRTQDIIRKSAYGERGRPLKPNDRVQAESLIYLWRAPWDETPVPQEIPVVYEDEHLLAVDKPPNLPVHPSARYHKNTLIMMLKAARPDEWLSLGHRIDRETSGVLLVSKSPECDRALKKQLEERRDLEKVYTALTWGTPPIGPGPTRIERNLELDPSSPYRVTMRVTDDETALYSSTVFEVLAERTSGGRTYAQVRATLETGRQHQIRVHLQSLGTPIVGDKLYGPDPACFARGVDGELTEDDEAMLEIPRHALHATKLRLEHPITKADLTIEAPFPKDLADFWQTLA